MMIIRVLLLLVTLANIESSGSNAMSIKNSAALRRKTTTTTRLPATTLPLDGDWQAQERKASVTMGYCAKTTATAVLADLLLVTVRGHFMRDVFLTQTGAITGLWIFWKIVFAANLWGASKLRLTVQEFEGAEKIDNVEKILNSMTRVWRVGAVVVSATVTLSMMSLFQQKVPGIQHCVIAVFLVSSVVSVILSTKESNALGFFSRAHQDTGSAARIRRRGLVTARTMLVLSAALFLQTAFIPIFARGQDSWFSALVIMTNIPTPLAIATLLIPLRRSFLQLLSEITESKTGELETSTEETILALSTAEIKFFSEVRVTVRNEMVFKLINSVVYVLQNGRSLLA